MNLLEGKVAIITGGGQGLGQACAKLFVRDGAKVVIADINAEVGARSAALLRESGAEAAFVHADVASEDDVKGMVDFAVRTFGRSTAR